MQQMLLKGPPHGPHTGIPEWVTTWLAWLPNSNREDCVKAKLLEGRRWRAGLLAATVT
jgi:hypothetical protein